MKKYNYITNLSKYIFHSVCVTKFSLYYDNDGDALDLTTCDSADWGMPSTLVIKSSETFPLPVRLEMRWISVLEKKVFEISEPLDQVKAEVMWDKQQQEFPDNPFRQYMIGIALNGGVAIWLCNNSKSVLLHWLQADEKPFAWEVDDEVFLERPQEMPNAIMSPLIIQSNMRQYQYRFVPLEEYFDGEKWIKFTNDDVLYEEIDLDGVEVKRLDGTFDYTDNDDIMRCHEVGKPQRITVRWHENDASFFAHFWLDETESTSFFDDFFNLFPNAQADLLLRIDTKANRYEIAMTGAGLPARSLHNTQYIVFKDYVEIARSEYFDKEDGEWRWF